MVGSARSSCPINAAAEAFGDSWSLLVLRAIHLGEPAPERDGPSVTERLARAYAAVL